MAEVAALQGASSAIRQSDSPTFKEKEAAGIKVDGWILEHQKHPRSEYKDQCEICIYKAQSVSEANSRGTPRAKAFIDSQVQKYGQTRIASIIDTVNLSLFTAAEPTLAAPALLKVPAI